MGCFEHQSLISRSGRQLRALSVAYSCFGNLPTSSTSHRQGSCLCLTLWVLLVSGSKGERYHPIWYHFTHIYKHTHACTHTHTYTWEQPSFAFFIHPFNSLNQMLLFQALLQMPRKLKFKSDKRGYPHIWHSETGLMCPV